MKNIFSSDWKYGNKLLLISILICASLIAYYHLRLGYSMSGDSHRFSRWADETAVLEGSRSRQTSIRQRRVRCRRELRARHLLERAR